VSRTLPAPLLRLLTFVALGVLAGPTYADADLWGHVRFGLDILSAGHVPSVDPYSFTSDVMWVNHEWLAEVLFAFAWTGNVSPVHRARVTAGRLQRENGAADGGGDRRRCGSDLRAELLCEFVDELGTKGAAEFTTHGLTVRHHVTGDLPPLTEASELVVYRVAQEGLTNTARHAGADRAEVRLRPIADGVELLVRDNGKGLGAAPEGAGIRGMRERALLIAADLSLVPGPEDGTDVRLRVPVTTGGR